MLCSINTFVFTITKQKMLTNKCFLNFEVYSSINVDGIGNYTSRQQIKYILQYDYVLNI